MNGLWYLRLRSEVCHIWRCLGGRPPPVVLYPRALTSVQGAMHS